MKIYLGQTIDSSHDNGFATVVVLAHDKQRAKAKAERHLKEIGRSDLIADLELQLLQNHAEEGVCFSDATNGSKPS